MRGARENSCKEKLCMYTSLIVATTLLGWTGYGVYILVHTPTWCHALLEACEEYSKVCTKVQAGSCNYKEDIFIDGSASVICSINCLFSNHTQNTGLENKITLAAQEILSKEEKAAHHSVLPLLGIFIGAFCVVTVISLVKIIYERCTRPEKDDGLAYTAANPS